MADTFHQILDVLDDLVDARLKQVSFLNHIGEELANYDAPVTGYRGKYSLKETYYQGDLVNWINGLFLRTAGQGGGVFNLTEWVKIASLHTGGGTGGGSAFVDVPTDGKTYARKDGAWVDVSAHLRAAPTADETHYIGNVGDPYSTLMQFLEDQAYRPKNGFTVTGILRSGSITDNAEFWNGNFTNVVLKTESSAHQYDQIIPFLRFIDCHPAPKLELGINYDGPSSNFPIIKLERSEAKITLNYDVTVGLNKPDPIIECDYSEIEFVGTSTWNNLLNYGIESNHSKINNGTINLYTNAGFLKQVGGDTQNVSVAADRDLTFRPVFDLRDSARAGLIQLVCPAQNVSDFLVIRNSNVDSFVLNCNTSENVVDAIDAKVLGGTITCPNITNTIKAIDAEFESLIASGAGGAINASRSKVNVNLGTTATLSNGSRVHVGILQTPYADEGQVKGAGILTTTSTVRNGH